MTNLTKTQDDADEAGRRSIMESGEPEMIIEMAMFLTFEFETFEGESRGAAERRCMREVRRRWRISNHDDLLRAQKVSAEANELRIAILEREIDGHLTH
jgi:hypothetical protein